MKIKRRKTKSIKIGRISIGANNRIAVQSMAKAKTSDSEAVIRQIKDLEESGCDIVRLAIADSSDAMAIREIKRKTKLPLVADIHFDWRLALEAIDNGIDKIRLNPGNIYKESEIKEVARAAKLARIPIRVGLNSGSLPKHSRASANIADKMVLAARDYIGILEKFRFNNIVVSLKASNVIDTMEAYRRMSKACAYPLHLGVTASGSGYKAAVKSAIAIGGLLSEGIGDTIRVSLTDKPQEEVKAGRAILESLDLENAGPQVISCPTCGRCKVNLVSIAREFQDKIDAQKLKLPLKVAIMGCVVNGPGEARQADLGVAFGKKECLLFKKGKPIRKVSPEECVGALLGELKK